MPENTVWISTLIDNDDRNKPRALTEEEITEITSVLPPVPAADLESSEVARSQIREKLATQLRSLDVAPNAIPRLKREIIYQHEASLVTPGSGVGAQTASAIGGASTQSTLNTFHQAGARQAVTSGFKSGKELMNAKLYRSTEICTIHFKNKHMKFRDVLDVRTKIEGVDLKSLIAHTEMVPSKDLPAVWWRNSDLWHLPASKWVLRLHMHSGELYKHRISLSHIANLIPFLSGAITTIIAPRSTAIIEIWPFAHAIRSNPRIMGRGLEEVAENLERLSDELLERWFLSDIFMETMLNLNVKGVAKIHNLVPYVFDEKNILEAFVGKERQRKLTERETVSIPVLANKKNVWLWETNPVLSKKYGLNKEHLVKIAEAANYKYQLHNDNFYIFAATDPFVAIKQMYDTDATAAKEWLKSNPDDILTINTALMDAMQYVYATVNLINPKQSSSSNEIDNTFRLLLAHPLVDSTRTTSNNMHRMAAAFGIEAALNTFTHEITENVQASVHPANVECMAEMIMSRGVPHGVSFSGISRQPIGHLTLSTVQRAFGILVDKANFGSEESAMNTSAAVALGARISLGTGICHIGYTEGAVTYLDEECYEPRNSDKLPMWLIEYEEEEEISEEIPEEEIVFEVEPKRVRPLADLLADFFDTETIAPINGRSEARKAVAPRTTAVATPILSEGLDAHPEFETEALEASVLGQLDVDTVAIRREKAPRKRADREPRNINAKEEKIEETLVLPPPGGRRFDLDAFFDI